MSKIIVKSAIPPNISTFFLFSLSAFNSLSINLFSSNKIINKNEKKKQRIAFFINGCSTQQLMLH